MSTKSITITVQKLSEHITSCVGNINDKPTALCKRLDVNDKRISETLESLSDASDSLKSSFDQKTCQILNIATSIYDGVKVRHESLYQMHVQPKEKTTFGNKQTDGSITINVTSDDRRNVQSSQ